MPTPPASCTARLLFTRSLVPRSQTTILPATLAGSSTGVPFQEVEKHRRTAVGSAPGRPAAWASIRPAETAVPLSEAPVYTEPLPSVTVARDARLCVPAATVVSQGL